VENLTLAGTENINATGNWLSNVFKGNSGNNIFKGGNGWDTVSYENYTGGAIIASLTITSSQLIDGYDTFVSIENLTGTSSADTLKGNSVANVLNGGAGVDILAGGAGNDTYIMDGETDIITEFTGKGTDTVESSRTYKLVANLENLTLTGSDIISGLGNSLNNVITGNSTANILSGYAGNDSLNGGAGDDKLYGGNGDDTAVYRGASTGYTFVYQNNSGLKVTDINLTDGNDGVDILTGIEKLQFSNRTIDMTSSVPGNFLLSNLIKLAVSPKADNGIDSAEASYRGDTLAYFTPVSDLSISGDGISNFQENSTLKGVYTWDVNIDWALDSKAGAYVARGNIEGKDTLVVAIRSLDEFIDERGAVQDAGKQEDYYNRVKPFYDQAIAYATNQGIQNIYIVGHSLGGGMAQKVMADYTDTSDMKFKSVIFGAIGVHSDAGYDARITSFLHDDDVTVDQDGNIIGLNNGTSDRRYGTEFIIEHDDYSGHGGHAGVKYVQTIEHLDFTMVSEGKSLLSNDWKAPNQPSSVSIKVADVFSDNVIATNYQQSGTVAIHNRATTDNAHVVIGGVMGDSLAGTTQDKDYIFGGGDSDTLYAGKGNNDELHGGYGNDVYKYWFGDGKDYAFDIGGNDRIDVKASDTDGNFRMNLKGLTLFAMKSGQDLMLKADNNLSTGNNSLSIENFYSSANNQVETLRIYGTQDYITAPGTTPPDDPGYVEVNLVGVANNLPQGTWIEFNV
jgi:Ca2+-binding RTX toxin-like protein